jgi:hypothetical protein
MGLSDFWVDPLSASIGLPERQKKVAAGSHTEIVKPPNKNSGIYQWVRDQLAKCLARFEYDVFLAMAMAGLDTEAKYQDYRNQAVQIEKWLQDYCGFKSIFYASRNIKTMDRFEAEDLSLVADLSALRRSKYFMLVYPDKIVSSVLFEAGIAVALGKPSVYFIRERNGVPFLMRKAEQANIPAGVRIYEYAGPPQLENLLRSSGESLWKYSVDKP